MPIKRKEPEAGVELQMTPFVDVVFQLLTFFIFTFNPSAQEGDFDIKMPLGSGAGDSLNENPIVPYQVRLQANASGQLTNISVGGINDQFGTSFDKLHRYFIAQVQNLGGPAAADLEAEIDPDYNLNYGSSISALTAISGDVRPGSREVTKLIEKVKFAPPGERR